MVNDLVYSSFENWITPFLAFSLSPFSNVTLNIDFDKIPYNKEIEKYGNYENWILYGGEDYKLVAVTDKKTLDKIPSNYYTIIGKVENKKNCPLEINFHDKILQIVNLDKTFNHFEEN